MEAWRRGSGEAGRRGDGAVSIPFVVLRAFFVKLRVIILDLFHKVTQRSPQSFTMVFCPIL